VSWRVPCAIAMLLSLLAIANTAVGQTKVGKPPVPPGRDPGGIAVALFSTGIDYTDPDIAKCLARDGEGELIGWDMVDNDRRPFPANPAATPANWGGDGSERVREIGCFPAVRIVPVRIIPSDPASLAKAVAFVALTPARIVVVPMWSSRSDDWEPFRQAAERFDLLFIVAAGDEGRDIDKEPVWPAAFKLANVVVVTSGVGDAQKLSPRGNRGPGTIDAVVLQGSIETTVQPKEPATATGWAATAAAWSLACGLHRHTPPLSAHELKTRLLAMRRPTPSADKHWLIDPICPPAGRHSR
jgi:hypothetical protein